MSQELFEILKVPKQRSSDTKTWFGNAQQLQNSWIRHLENLRTCTYTVGLLEDPRAETVEHYPSAQKHVAEADVFRTDR